MTIETNITNRKLDGWMTVACKRYIAMFRKFSNTEQVIAAMAELGFVRAQAGTCEYCFLHLTDQYVVKFNYVQGGYIPSAAVPTVVATFSDLETQQFPNGLDYSNVMMVQRLADTDESAAEYIYNQFVNGDAETWGHDAHQGNVGLFRGEPAVFDW